MLPTNSRRFLTISLTKLSRSKRKSFTSGVAYILRGKFKCPRLGRTHNHSRKGGIVGWGMNGWAGSVESLSLAASYAERRKDAVEGRELILAFPRELPKEDCLRLLAVMASYLWESFQVASVFALHEPDRDGDRRNRHGHLVFTSRRVKKSGTVLGEKTREWDTQAGRGHLENLRSYWCQTLNEELSILGAEPNIEHRSFARLGIDQEPTRHRGVARTAFERREKKQAWKLRPLPMPGPIAPVYGTTDHDQGSAENLFEYRVGGPAVLPLFVPSRPLIQPGPRGSSTILGHAKFQRTSPSL